MNKSRINNELPFAIEGLPFIIISCSIVFIFAYLQLLIPTVLTLIITLFIIYFFRDPERNHEVPDNAVLTPADGKIIQILHLNDNNNPLGEPAVKISIFMSIFNVHVNRIPISGIIKNITYFPGKFFSADLDKASEQNERNKITLQTHDNHKIVFIQIAGLIARRIACWVRSGENMHAGQRFGLIRFGSRLEVYLPENTKITVQLKQKVSAGKTVIGHLL